VQRQRATIVKPGTMLVAQPELPIPLVVQFPFPAWATRASEAGAMASMPAAGVAGMGNGTVATHADDPFAGFPSG
jgi:hypothetical protein